jgi:HK97 family phage portal protein
MTPTPRGRGAVSRAFSFFSSRKQQPYIPSVKAYVQPPGQPVWSGRSYLKFAEEAYRRNVVAYRAIGMIARGAGSVPVVAFERLADGTKRPVNLPLLRQLLTQPNPALSGQQFFENLYSYRLIGGNAYVQSVGPFGEVPRELHLLRPDRVQIIAGAGGMPAAYRYKVEGEERDYPVDRLTGASRILHLKDFHPSQDWYGLSPVEAAAYSIDQHNQAAAWNQALLQNGARPSGALVVKLEGGAALSEDQFTRLKQQIDEQFSGPDNAGRPMLLEGGLDWREMSLSPKDMDFIQAKHSAARDIALAFGVPPQLLGIPGDNTYSNLAEARLALWEQTILPLVQSTLNAMEVWLGRQFGLALEL